MGIRESEQSLLWVAAAELPKSPGHPFYMRLNALLDAHDFDPFVEGVPRVLRAGHGPTELGWPVFSTLLVGYFEGIDSERGIAWRANSLAVRSFLRLGLEDAPPDASTTKSITKFFESCSSRHGLPIPNWRTESCCLPAPVGTASSVSRQTGSLKST